MKYLITSDLHIDDYFRYNIPENNRFDQFIILADLLIEKAKSNNISNLIIAGDIINKPTNLPYINHKLDDVFLKLTAYFQNIYYILGQHDLSTKSIESNFEDSDINRLTKMFSNLHYMNNKTLNDEGHITYFKNWSIEQELNIDTPVDLMIGHLTIKFGIVKGQDIDNTKFKLGIFGDIHKHVIDRNLVSIGSPIQVKIDDPIDGTCIIYDTNTSNYKVELIDPNRKLPKIQYISDMDAAGSNLKDNTFYVYRPENITIKKDDLNVPTWTDTNTLVEDIMKTHKLSEIHEKVKSGTNYSSVNFSFKLIDIKITNIKSIKKLHHTFNNNLLLIGNNGSGKSSFIDSLLLALKGGVLSNYTTIGEKSSSIELTLEYEKNTYVIYRSTKNDSFIINGSPSHNSQKKDIQQEILNRLPFINYIDCYIIPSSVSTVLGSMNSSRRIELLSKQYKLDLLDSYYDVAKDKLSLIVNDLSGIQIKKQDISSKLNSIEDQLSQHDLSGHNSINIKDVESKLADCMKISSQYDKITRLNNEKNLVENNITNINNEYNNKVNRCSELEGKISDTSSLVTRVDVLQKTKEEYDSKKKSHAILCERINNGNEKINSVNRNLQNLSNKICPTCNGVINENKILELKSKYDKELNLYNSVIEKLHSEKKTIEDAMSAFDLKKDLQELDSLKEKINFVRYTKNELERTKSELSGISNRINTTKEKLNSINEELSKWESSDIMNTDMASLINTISNYKNIINSYANISKLIGYKEEYKDKLIGIDGEFNKLDIQKESYSQYCNLLEKDNKIYVSILNKFTENFTNETFKFKTLSYRKNGNPYSDLSIFFRNKNTWMEYEKCSSGQKTLCDIYFLYRVIFSSGLLVFDEFFKFLDDSNLDIIQDYISEMNISTIVISSHSDNILLPYDKLKFTLDESGSSKVN